MDEIPEDVAYGSPRQFASVAEIEAEPGYKPDNPIDATSYRRIVGYYRFEDEIDCRFQRTSGTLCRRGHQYGFVAALADGSVTLVGNHCAKARFGVGSRFDQDRRHLENRRKRYERLGRLAGLLEQRAAIELSLIAVREGLRRFRDGRDALHALLGPCVVARLTDMARTGRGGVAVTAVYVRHYVDEEGVHRTEHQKVERRIGSVSGLEAFGSAAVAAIAGQVSEVSSALVESETLARSKKTASDFSG
jgi:hypothetical protein